MACTCRTFVGESDKELVVRAKAAADSIFVGRVVKILKEKDRRGVPTGDYIAVFNVTEMWKGKRRKQIRIVNGGTDRCCLCGWRFTKSEEYLVFVDVGTPNPSICGRTK